MSTYDVPTITEVLQQDVDPDIPITVPVEVQGVVRTDEMPTISYYRNVVVAGGDRTQKVLQANPRRKRTIIWAQSLGSGVEMIAFGESEGKATQFSGAMLFFNTTMAVRYELTDKGPLYVRGAIVNDTAGTWTGFAVATDDAILSIIEELWAE